MFKPGSDSVRYISDKLKIFDSETHSIPLMELKPGVRLTDPCVQDALQLCGMEIIGRSIVPRYIKLRRLK